MERPFLPGYDRMREEVREETISVVLIENSGKVMYFQFASVLLIPMSCALT